MRSLIWVGFILAVVGAYLFGGIQGLRYENPIRQISITVHDILRPNSGILDILTNFPGKIEVNCPYQTNKTKVILLMGQSNAANGQGQRNNSAYGDRIINYYNGRCYIANSPLLGNSGDAGESWTMLGNKLIESRAADRVILVPSAIGGSNIRRWVSGGDIYPIISKVISDVVIKYRVTDVIWHQGESDAEMNTSASSYKSMFGDIVRYIRAGGISAPIFVSVASRCNIPNWTADNPVTEAQRALPDPKLGIYAGVDTDALLGPYDRFEGCHFDYTGQQKFTDAMVKVLQAHAASAAVATN